MIAKDLVKDFKEKGYCVLREFFSPSEAATLIDDIKNSETIDGVSLLNKGSMAFYSGVYHRSSKLQSFISQPKLVDLLKQVMGPDIWVRWDQAVAKGPGSGTFPWHQDNAYNGLKDGHYQLWIALTEMTPDNGGLWLVPGSHKQKLPHRKAGNHMVYQGEVKNPIFIEAQPGDVVLFSSFLLHSTTPNVTQNSRWAYVVEYMSLEHFDPDVKPPYFVVARKGVPTAEFVNYYRGQLNPINRLKYWRQQLRRWLSLWRSYLLKGTH